MNKPPPPLPVRVCPRHGLVAGPDGRCVICHRTGDGRAAGSESRRVVGMVLGALAIVGGVLVWKGAQGRRGPDAPPARPETAPVRAAPPATVADDDPGPPSHEEAKEQRRFVDEQKRQRSLEDEMHKVPVRMFITKKCDLCDAARDWMKQQGITFTELDVDADPTALQTLRKIAPGDQVPVFDVEGEVLVGFGPTNVAGAVRRAADKHTRSRF